MIIVGTVWEASASNPAESGIVGKNFSFDLWIEVLHRFEPGNALSSLWYRMAVVSTDHEIFLAIRR
jgi:hypothetical protein